MEERRPVRWRLELIALFLLVLLAGGLACVTIYLMVSNYGDARPTVNLVAYVGNDGNLWLVSPDDEESRAVTTDGIGYHFPTWSPNSKRLAFLGPDDTGNPVLYGFDDTQSGPTVLFESPDAAPFYLYWSDDNRSVTFLTQEATRMALRVADADNPGKGRLLAQGAPFYWVWSPRGDELFMHVGGSRAFSEDAHLSLLENQEGAERVALKVAPGSFQAPIWSRDGQYIFYVAADDEGRDGIYKTNMESSIQTFIVPLNGPSTLVPSPDDQHIAYLELPSTSQFPPLGSAYLVDTDGENHREILADTVAAMYWSPDGSELAILTLMPGGRLRWWIYEVATQALEPLVSFVPTLEFLQTVPFFDQYHHSLTFWSPDSRYLLVSRSDGEGSEASIWIIDTTGQEAPRQIGQGTFAVWSWQ
jgi:Tol biopolymer transport system component